MKNRITETLNELLHIDSPTGFTSDVIEHIESMFGGTGLYLHKTNKGGLLVSFTEKPELILTAHIDTLGAMVKELKCDGTLEITQLGSYPLNSFEGEYVTVRNSSGKLYRGTFLLNNPSDHVNKRVRSENREFATMSVRLDEKSRSSKDLKSLGIAVGDFIFYDKRFELTKSGFVKSRFLDDKACAAVMIELIRDLKGRKPVPNAGFFFSNYEEVGHGGCSGIPGSAKELLVLDMAVVGDGCTGREEAVSICVKDSSGPYDFHVTSKLRQIASKKKIDYETDIYPHYGSDGSAALSAGYDVRVGLIGPGVSASHGVERTHIKGIQATYDLARAYIENSK
ncbi:MAG: M42 family metallopeptidase [Ignavibacteria bacterium]|nr:M42 family metallopeptidase [Ignavibacteria bacterium]